MSTEMYDTLVGELRANLKWCAPHAGYVESGGNCVLMLVFGLEDDFECLGYVSKVEAGHYWFIACPKLVCAYVTTDEGLSLNECKTQLFNYALNELVRLYNLSGRMDNMVSTKLRNSDMRACESYKEHFGAVDDDSFDAGFHSGFDRGVKTQGLPRKPTWAKYLVQNRDGTLVWFEQEPECALNDGVWTCSAGRSRKVSLHNDWTGSIKRLK